MECLDSHTTAPSWLWLVDIERACTLLIGRCLGGMMMGIPLTAEEIQCHSWINSPLFGSGAEPLSCDIGTAHNILITKGMIMSHNHHILVLNCTVFNPLTPTVAIWYCYKASCARPR